MLKITKRIIMKNVVISLVISAIFASSCLAAEQKQAHPQAQEMVEETVKKVKSNSMIPSQNIYQN